jgi:hypothetical protein
MAELMVETTKLSAGLEQHRDSDDPRVCKAIERRCIESIHLLTSGRREGDMSRSARPISSGYGEVVCLFEPEGDLSTFSPTLRSRQTRAGSARDDRKSRLRVRSLAPTLT